MSANLYVIGGRRRAVGDHHGPACCAGPRYDATLVVHQCPEAVVRRTAVRPHAIPSEVDILEAARPKHVPGRSISSTQYAMSQDDRALHVAHGSENPVIVDNNQDGTAAQFCGPTYPGGRCPARRQYGVGLGPIWHLSVTQVLDLDHPPLGRGAQTAPGAG
jgi:hypothetical protein